MRSRPSSTSSRTFEKNLGTNLFYFAKFEWPRREKSRDETIWDKKKLLLYEQTKIFKQIQNLFTSLVKVCVIIFFWMELSILKVTKMRSDSWSGGIGNSKGRLGGLTESSLDPFRVIKIKSETICFCKIAWETLFQKPTFQYIEQGEIINRAE